MPNETKEVWEELLALTRTFYALVTEVNDHNPYVQPLKDLEDRILQRLDRGDIVDRGAGPEEPGSRVQS